MQVPNDLKYTSEHEWVKEDGKIVTVGITDFAQDSLGDIVYVQLPTVGGHYDKDSTLGEIESTKSVSDIYCPLAGTIVEINTGLSDAPEIINTDPYGEGWICKLEIDALEEAESLMSANEYINLTES